MPYVPSKKTDGKSTDREVICEAVDILACQAASRITDNRSLIKVYSDIFIKTARTLSWLIQGGRIQECELAPDHLAGTIFLVAKKYDYAGAELGEFNYAITKLIQQVPQIKVARGDWKETDEFRYWLYACTASALVYASRHTEDLGIGLDGVFIDIKDEYKWKVNRPYEAAQILKSGDCYYAPYYTRLVEMANESGEVIGHMDILLKRDASTLSKDVLDWQLVLKKK
ncbi:MAG: hypothetical protein HYT65_00735 [Candidatus Yanofskybacteria bacterium]|nr:hypothetical protein [Candidatus Yanofskybacteria bacterium]